MAILISITFLSAFLLFQIELIIAKLFLPSYGGSYLVWGACIVFFQAVLLAGYCFAHMLLRHRGMRHYLKIHLWLLFIPFLFFPVRDIHFLHYGTSLPLVVDIFWRLTMTIGPVFFVLSTMSLVTQSWLAMSVLKGRDNPYGLYAVSNLGSFAALFSYPFFFEQFLTNTEQLQIWRLLYAILVLANVIACWRVKPDESFKHVADVSPFGWVADKQILRWLCLGAAGVVMFLSVTNIMTYEVAPVPLLWVVPLGIYLMAFVLNFKKNPWCPSWIIRFIGPIIGLQALMYFLSQKHILPVLMVIALLCGFLFFICMYTQNQLILSKPASERQMTLFYVMISLGGFLGGILTSWIIPLISNTLIEYLVGLFLVALMMPSHLRKVPVWRLCVYVLMVVLAFFVWPHVFKDYHVLPFVLLWGMVWFAFWGLAKARKFFIAVLVGIIIATCWLESIWQNVHFIIKKRNYYGIYEVYDSANGVRALVHGTTLHGAEFIDEEKRVIPLGYYSPTSAVGGLLTADVFEAKRVGVVGLGTGTLSMYAKPSCPIDYYELDGDVSDIAGKYFWYLAKAPGSVNIILGDARLSLEKMPDAWYDLLIIDAFSGDAIPIHLVNKDVILEYEKKLALQGAAVFHITNRYLNLKPVLVKIAQDTGAFAAFKDVPDGGFNMRSIWCLLTWDGERFFRLISKEGWQPLDTESIDKQRVWTDDYSTILPIINMDELAVSLKTFKFLTW
ncbi:MAG: fused MFS/spermidine synthase [Candidatus Omnitrophica bacterium]|nr:fused MFS/spermidine synthase [Candidatus Omnitrophota bacterium]